MKNITAGSHIKTSRLGYSHHGIYCGSGKVVHYSGFAQALKKGALEVTTIENFLGSEMDCYIVQYASHKLKYSKSEIVERAFSRIGEDSYNLAFNNCEHFATWCVTGRGESKQVRSVLTHTTAAAVSYHSIRTASTATQVAGFAASSAKALSGTTASGFTMGRLAGCATGAIGGAALSTSGAAVGTTALLGTTGVVSGTTALGFMAAGAAAAPIALPALAVVGAGALIGGFLGGFFD